MPALARGQENQTGIINWFITISGTLTDAFEVGFRILDITGGLPGAQVFPITVGDFETVTNAPGRFNVGSYHAYDNAGGVGWTPSITQTIGTHRVEWRWKSTALAPFQLGAEDFEVLVQAAGGSVDTYISIQDVRDAGLDVADFSDEEVLAAIEVWQSFLDRATRQWFIPKSIILSVDGTDSDAIHFGVPIIAIDYVRINNSTTNLESQLFKVYSAIRYPDDRRNPRIKLVNERDLDIFTAPVLGRKLKFRKGRQNQEIKGTFGFTEDDGSVPRLIQRALLKLVIEKLTLPVYTPDPATAPVPPSPLVGNLIEEWTDSHKRKYGHVGGEVSKRRPGLSGITSDPEILDIIKLYRAPIGVATPAHPSIN
jgi:hypothetical protein